MKPYVSLSQEPIDEVVAEVFEDYSI